MPENVSLSQVTERHTEDLALLVRALPEIQERGYDLGDLGTAVWSLHRLQTARAAAESHRAATGSSEGWARLNPDAAALVAQIAPRETQIRERMARGLEHLAGNPGALGVRWQPVLRPLEIAARVRELMLIESQVTSLNPAPRANVVLPPLSIGRVVDGPAARKDAHHHAPGSASPVANPESALPR
ncbi:hypothetical protein [Actinoplanes sp. NPDC051851]|uniref:hypothetical protein n=1 Tax=Actinoplanes sp. NPDC051851 TaxID=3154753 RepID=UPI0034224362